MKQHRLSHFGIIALGYLIIIAVGTFLLTLPFASADGIYTSPLEALFTATSASCVTGLVVRDTATYWSFYGQLIIIVLIQTGGLGFMTIAIFMSRLIKRRSGLRARVIMAESINTDLLGGFSSLTKRIIAGTALLEGAGAVLLSIRFVPAYGMRKGIYYGIFHSVSAFCNAGFDLMGSETGEYSSLVGWSGDVVVNVTVMALIVLGGLGFLVWDDILRCRFRFRRFRLQTKLVLTTTCILIFGGALLMLIFEFNFTGSGLSVKDRLLTAFFGSVTARTAGFNTVDTSALSPAGKLLTMILMFIGGSSGSTAGGVKTTTIAVLLIFMLASFRGERSAHTHGRRLEDGTLKKATVILTVNILLALSGAIIICAVQSPVLSDAFFEAVSAIGTVGMTTGITRSLGTVSRTVIIFLMYCGRVGSISFALALFEKKSAPPVTYPDESVTVG